MLAYLGAASLTDLCMRRIPLFLTGVFGGVGMLLLLYHGDWVAYGPGLLVGGLFLGLAFVTREAVGRGDALVILGLGAFLDWQQLMGTLFLALMACAPVALVLLVVFRKDRRTELPFVPFLLLGYAGGLLLW